MSKIQNTKNRSAMEELKSVMLKANYQVDIGGLIPSQPLNPSFNPQLPYFKGQSSANHYINTQQSCQVSKKNDNSSKRLKLKDYLHLNSIQKKVRNRPSSSCSVIESDTTIKTDQKVMKHSRMRTSALIGTQCTVSNKKDYLQTFKTEINQQIQDEIKRLQDLAAYLKNDHVRGPNQKEEKVLLCQIHSTLQKGAQIHSKLGQRILRFQQTNSAAQKDKTRRNKYFWDENNKILSSPAKLKEGLDLTCLVFGTFAAEPKKH